jgi:hypothetical protein
LRIGAGTGHRDDARLAVIARPSPRSMRPGNSASSVPNCSAITSGEWLGSMIPPAPMRMRCVAAPICAITTAVAAEAMPRIP